MDPYPFNVLSLCSGIGGLDFGLKLAVPASRVVCYVEREAFCCEVLASKMEEGWLDSAPIWTDLRTFDGAAWCGVVDCIIAGYPCQPFSTAGKQLGAKDPRHLWPDVARIVSEVKPAYCFFENVGNHLRMGFEQVHDDLRSMDYRIAAGLFTAEEVGASHKRERLFILAYSGSEERDWLPGFQRETLPSAGVRGSTVANTHCRIAQRRRDAGDLAEEARGIKGETEERQWCGHAANNRLNALAGSLGPGNRLSPESREDSRCPVGGGCDLFPPRPTELEAWSRVPGDLSPATAQSTIRGMAYGLSTRIHRLRALGNAVVPLVAAYAWSTLQAALEARD